jgi:hypothetical protein
MSVRYFVQIIIPRFTRGPHVESRTLKLKARVHTLKFQRFCLKFCWQCFRMTVRYFVQFGTFKSTHMMHMKNGFYVI